MPFNRPSLATLIERAKADAEGHVTGIDTQLRRSVVNVLMKVHAGALHGAYGALDYLSQQILPDTAGAAMLARHASVHGIERRPAVAATGKVLALGVDGAVIGAGVLLQRIDRAEFVTTTNATIANGQALVDVSASIAGELGNTEPGTQLFLSQTVAGVDSVVSVCVGGLAGGKDAATDDELLADLLAHLREPPHGGAVHDYVAWAKAAHPEVTRAWVEPLAMGANTVTVRVATDNTGTGLIPHQSVVDAVQAYIEQVRPVTTQVYVVAPVPKPVNFSLHLTPDTEAVRHAVTAELADVFTREAQPGGTVLISHLREAISFAAGEYDHELLAPLENLSSNPGELLVMGNLVVV